MIGDSLVCIGAFSKGRSSSPPVLRLCRRLGALLLATGSVVYWRWVQTYRNWSDGVSRGKSISVAVKEGSIPQRSRVQWRGFLPEEDLVELYSSSRSSF